MLKTTLRALFWLTTILVAVPVFAQDSTEEESKVDMPAVIMEHIKDAHDYHILDLKDDEGNVKPVAIPLPVILIDNGLQVFSSTKLYHGDKVSVELGNGEEADYFVNTELGYGLYEEKVYKLNGQGLLDFDSEGAITSVRPLDFSITKNVFALLFSASLLIWIAVSTARSYNKEEPAPPRGIARVIEPLVIFVRDDIAKNNIGEAKYQKYMPYLLTAFFFIFLNALLGLVPIFPGGSNLAGNISFALVLALITLILTVFSGNKHYWGHIFATPGVPKWLLPIMVPVEVIGIFTKPFALTIRLFANMSAGHIIILALVGIIFTFESAAWSGLAVPMALFIYVLKLLVSFLQAFIFTMLSALFIGEAVAEEH